MAAALVFLSLLGIVEQVMVARITGTALLGTQEITADIRMGRLSGAMEKARVLDQTWDSAAKKLELLVDHSSTDEVRYAFSRLLAALEGEDRAGALIYAGELEGAIEHVHERQALTPENIL